MMAMKYEIKVVQKEIKKEMMYKDSVVLTYKIQYPQFDSRSFQRMLVALNYYYEEKAKAFQTYCEKNLFWQAVEDYQYAIKNQFPVHQYEALLVYTVTYHQNCALSLYFDQYEYTGGAHGNTVRSSDTWNLNQGRKYELRDFFPYYKDYKKNILKNINEQIGKQIAEETKPYFNEYNKLTADHFNASNFYITTEGVVIYYQQYDVAPYVSGIVEFMFPYEKGKVVPPVCRLV